MRKLSVLSSWHSAGGRKRVRARVGESESESTQPQLNGGRPEAPSPYIRQCKKTKKQREGELVGRLGGWGELGSRLFPREQNK